MRLYRSGFTIAVLAGVLLAALCACSTSSVGPATTPPTAAASVGSGAQNFQLRPVLRETSGAAVRCPSQIDASPEPSRPVVACSVDQRTRFALGPAFVTGEDAVSATAAQPQNGQAWVISVDFTERGKSALLDATTRLYQQPPPRNLIAIMVDGFVFSAPAPNGPIDGGIEISSNLDQQRAELLAQRIVPTS